MWPAPAAPPSAADPRVRDAARLTHDGSRTALVVGGVVQSIDVTSADASEYWTAMLTDAAPQFALLLGAGGGTLAALLTRRFPRLRIVAVDDDPEVVALGRSAFYLALPNVDVVLADAFRFAATCPRRFDYVAVDLFRGGERPREMLGRPFLGDLRRLTAPGGRVAFNMFQDRRTERAVSRLERAFLVMRRIRVGRNVVLHCRPR